MLKYSCPLLMVGSFGFKKGTYGGEDVKNRLLNKGLLREGIDVRTFDTSGWRDRVFMVIKELLFQTLSARPNILLCSHAIGSSTVLPYLIVYKYLLRRKIAYLVVGFAINEFIEKYSILASVLKNVDQIIVETKLHKDYLLSKGISNVEHINNFRDVETETRKELNKTRTQQLRVIYFTRIDKRKPIDRVVEIIKYINSKNLEEKYLLNIYGKVHKEYEERFMSKISGIKNIAYQGIVDAKEISSTMMNHDVMIYPISAREDVFPGVFLDAFSGKLPVIAKSSNYVAEIIKDHINGFLISSDDNQIWLEKLESVRQMQDYEYSNFSESTYNNALQYDTKKVLAELIGLLKRGNIL